MPNILLIQACGHYQTHLTTLLGELDIEYVQAGCCRDLGSNLRNNNSSLVCYLFDESAGNGILANLQIPHHIPLLVIHSGDSGTQVPVTKEVCELVDFIQAPFSRTFFQHKISFLQSISRRLKTLTDLQEETERLRSRINELNRSVDGHNSFLDLMSRRDGLTGMFNRRHFNSVIQNTFQASTEGNNEISLCILNIDYFNEINKSCGQDFGDFVLNELSARITNSIRESDISFRLSGEEFAILMMDAALPDAMNRAEEIRTLCESKKFDNGNHTRNVTISVGVASVTAHMPSSHDEFFNMADQALFIAKSEGRNRVMQHVPADRGGHGTTEHNFKILKDTISKILDKTKISTVRSLQLLAQGIIDEEENEQIEQVQLVAQLFSQQLRFPPALIDTFRNSIVLLSSLRFLLHNEMINKEGRLSENEWDVIADFPYKLGQLTDLFDYFSGERTILLHHGERFDGSGYPEGLEGEEIPIASRIFSLINAFAAMNSDRPYRKKLSPDEILHELKSNAGKQFDPFLVTKLIDVIEEKKILHIDKKSLDDARTSILKITQK